jgi:hypothetical protein
MNRNTRADRTVLLTSRLISFRNKSDFRQFYKMGQKASCKNRSKGKNKSKKRNNQQKDNQVLD